MYLLLSSVFITILQIFNLEVALICDQVRINVGAYDPECCSQRREWRPGISGIKQDKEEKLRSVILYIF